MALRFFLLGFLFAAALVLPASGFAQSKATAKLLGSYGAWKAYSYNEKDEPVCYMTLAAHPAANKKIKRGGVYLMITHRPGENSKDVVSYTAGYAFKPLSEVTATVGKKSFNLFTQKDTAWSRDAATDHALAVAIRDGANIKLSGTPGAKGAAPLTDTIDLKGAAPAYQAIGKACGYAEEKKAVPAKKK